MNSSQILGVKIDSLTLSEALERTSGFLSASGQHVIFTPNPEMLVKARSDLYFKAVLNNGDLNICDGFGVSLVSGFRIKRITGVDFMLDLCALAEQEGKSVYLLGSGSDDVVKKAAEELKRKSPKLIIAGFNKGPKIEEKSLLVNESRLEIVSEENTDLIRDINQQRPAILFVAFGMGKQEKWIYENLPKLPSVKIAMGVGGSVDYLGGHLRRPPRLMRTLGLEWLYRLFCQPERFGRIWNATAKFLFLCIFTKF